MTSSNVKTQKTFSFIIFLSFNRWIMFIFNRTLDITKGNSCFGEIKKITLVSDVVTWFFEGFIFSYQRANQPSASTLRISHVDFNEKPFFETFEKGAVVH